MSVMGPGIEYLSNSFFFVASGPTATVVQSNCSVKIQMVENLCSLRLGEGKAGDFTQVSRLLYAIISISI